MKEIFIKIADTITIVFPALVTVLGILGLTKVVPIAENIEQVLLVVLGASASVCSIWFNKLSKVVR